MRWRGLIPVWLLIVCPSGAVGQVHYVSHWGTHTPPYSTWATAATNLVDAVNAAASGATIWVSNGIYRTGAASGGGLPARVRLTRSVALRSLNGARQTVIEGAPNSDETPLGSLSVRGVYMTNGLIDGFTVRRGHTATTGEMAATVGGGIYAIGGTQLNMRVAGNRGQSAGGAWLGRCRASNVMFDVNYSEAGARVRTDRRVRMTGCRVGTRSLPVPDLKILGTNGEVVVNGDAGMAAGTGVSYAGVPRGTGTATHVFTLVNWGEGALDVERVSFQGGDAGEFELVSAPSNAVIEPGGEEELEIRFAPQIQGLRRVLLFVANDDPDDDPYGLWLEGEGLQAEMRVLGTNGEWIANGSTNPVIATGADFGLCVSEPVRRVFAITNAGTYGLGLTGTPYVVVQGANPGDFSVVRQPEGTIGVGESVQFEMEFFPSVAEVRTAEVVIGSEDTYHTNGVYRFAIRGECPATNWFINARADLRGAAGSAMVWGDCDNDGLLDLAMMGYDGTNRFTEIRRNLGGGSYSNIQAGLVALESGQMVWGDYNNDGWLDLAVAGMGTSSAVTKIYRNQGDGSFVDAQAGLPGAVSGGLAWGDYDNDGDLDLVLSGYTLSTGISRVYRNDGGGKFTYVNHGLTPVQNGRAVWMDVNRDGWLDLMMTGESGTSKTTRLYRNIDGVLTNYPLAAVSGSAYGGLGVGDLNNDGWSDFALTGYGDEGMLSAVYRFNGSSNLFALATNGLAALWLGTAEWGDLDNNGWQDVMISGEQAGGKRAVNLYANTGGVLSERSTQIPGLRISSVAMGDSDRDGDLDVAVSGLSTAGYYSAVFRNLGGISNGPPSAPAGLTATLTNGNEIVFGWGASSDDLTPSASLTYNLYVGTASNPVAVMSPHADLSTGQRQIVAMGNMQHRREWHLKQLPSGEQIVWGVQAVDGAYAGGPFTAGTPVDTDLLPDLVVSSIQVMNVPFQATMTVSNQGRAASSAPVTLSAWLNRSASATCGLSSDLTNTVGVLNVGETEQVVFADMPVITNAGVYTFRVFLNSDCDPPVREIRMDNNQRTQVYTNRIYDSFWFNAVPLTNSVYLRWAHPTNVGMQSSQVLLRWSDTAYPATTNDGTTIYNGTNQSYHHTGLTPLVPHYYSIWLTHDGAVWYEPPE